MITLILIQLRSCQSGDYNEQKKNIFKERAEEARAIPSSTATHLVQE